ncbi:MAG: MaoC family dehydratase [Peptococcaceae bacterium]
MIKERHFSDFEVGSKDSFTKKITAGDVLKFSEATGDVNPVHLDEEYARKTIFKKRIAHGMISAGMISAVLGTKLPGPGAIYMSQTLKFKAPVYLGDELTAVAEVVAKDSEKKRFTIKTYVENQDHKVVTEGEALILFNN